MELALAAGELDYEALLRRLPAQVLRDWWLYHQINPIGTIRADARTAQIVAMLHNLNVKKEHQKPIKDFMLPWPEKSDEEKAAEQLAMVERQMAMMYHVAAMYAAGVFGPDVVEVPSEKAA